MLSRAKHLAFEALRCAQKEGVTLSLALLLYSHLWTLYSGEREEGNA